jgi:hypothetical protein
MTIDWNDNERNMIGFLSAKMAQVGREMGAREVVAPPLPRRYDVKHTGAPTCKAVPLWAQTQVTPS